MGKKTTAVRLPRETRGRLKLKERFFPQRYQFSSPCRAKTQKWGEMGAAHVEQVSSRWS
jgi:hypothetical protein